MAGPGDLKQAQQPCLSAQDRTAVDYATKLIVLLSVAMAILLEAYLAARAWPNQLPITIAAFFLIRPSPALSSPMCPPRSFSSSSS